MFSVKRIILLAIMIVSTGLLISIQAQEKTGRKKRIAVFSFDDKADNHWRLWGDKSVGDGMADMVVTELVKSGQYRVVEREQINKLLAEQDLLSAGVVTQESAAKIGQMLGVEVAVFGAVTEFGYKKDDTNIRLKGVGVGLGKQSAIVGVDIRMVNTSTGEIIIADNVRSTKTGFAPKISTRKFSFNNQQSFDQSLVGKVAREAVDNVINTINNQVELIAWSAKIITVKGEQIYINSGAQDGVKVGDVFTVISKGEVLIDPDTGLELGSIDQEIGTIKIVDNSVGEGKASICSIIKGSGFTRGNLIRETEF